MIQNNLSRQHLIQPIGMLRLSNELNGCQHWESVTCALNVHEIKNDIHSISLWLETYQYQAVMFRTSRSAIEKLLLWCLVERGHSLNEVQGKEVEIFVYFLTDINPYSLWVGKTKTKRNSATWKPYAKKNLNTSSISLILVHLKLYFRFVIENGRLDLIPLECELMKWTESIRSRWNCANKFITPPKILLRHWVLLRQQLPEACFANRAQLEMIVVLEFLYFAGLTIGHIHKLMWDDLQPIFENGVLVTWKIPLKDRFGGHVYSIATLTGNLGQLKHLHRDSYKKSMHSCMSSRIICRSTCYFEIQKIRKLALNSAQILKLSDDFNILNKLNTSQIRGGAMFIAQLKNFSPSLIEVYGELLLLKYPLMRGYLQKESYFDTDKAIQAVKLLSDWFAKQEYLENQLLLNFKKMFAAVE